MAFHQPTRQSMHRAVRSPAEERENPAAQSLERHHDQQEELGQSQTWVLFSPATECTTTSGFIEAVPSQQTPGRSRLSDLGSLNTGPRSDHHGETDPSATPPAIEDDVVEDDAELDSLDSHLPSFRSLPRPASHSQNGNNHAAPVFPGHDGLGSFHLDNPTSGLEAQDQLYQFERFNPRRVRRRRESMERVQAEWESERTREAEKRQRIEAWRLEHSRVLLDDIQRETRRRRRSQASLQRVQTIPGEPKGGAQQRGGAESDNMTWHDEDAAVSADEPESFLARFTHRVIKDLLGIDDRMLSVLLGEAIPEEEELASTPRASQLGGQAGQDAADESSWKIQLLERVSRELGLLVNHLSQHPGAFSTYSRIQQMPLPYAGLPVIPETSTTPPTGEAAISQNSDQMPAPEFRPTVNQPSRPIDIPGRQTEASASEDVGMSNTFTKEEWERDLDIKLVFRYIRSRFTSRANSSAPLGGTHLATSSTQDMAAKAARVRQHHPLVSRSRTTERRGFKATAPSNPVALRHHSSCASQSTRRSARRSSCSSRHYWDIGGSLGTGSVIASNGPMGSWGEV